MKIEEVRTKNLKRLVGKDSITEFAGKIGKHRSLVSQWVHNSLSSRTGKPMYISDRTCREIEKALNLPERWFDTNQSDAETPEVGYEEERYKYEIGSKHREVPLYKRPDWNRMEEKGEPIGWFTCPIENCSEKTYALEVRDDAMLDHTGRDSVLKGDIVFIDENEPYKDGDMVLATSEEFKLVSIKKYIVQDSIGVLYTANPTWQRQFIRIDDGTVKIHGTVIAALRLRR